MSEICQISAYSTPIDNMMMMMMMMMMIKSNQIKFIRHK